MNNVDKPIKPRWFVIVDVVVMLALLHVVLLAWTWLTTVLKQWGIPPMLAMILSVLVLTVLVHGVILRRWKVRK